MTRSKNILEEYRRGDLNKRLNLFLECPSLRIEFLEIDQSEAAGDSLFVTAREEGLEVRGAQLHSDTLA